MPDSTIKFEKLIQVIITLKEEIGVYKYIIIIKSFQRVVRK